MTDPTAQISPESQQERLSRAFDFARIGLLGLLALSYCLLGIWLEVFTIQVGFMGVLGVGSLLGALIGLLRLSRPPTNT